MNRISWCGAVSVGACALAVLWGGTAAAGEAQQVTYSQEISRIVQAKCQECHRPKGLGPFSLMSYRQVKGWGKMIQEVVNSKRMPPWGLDPHVGEWANDPSFTPEELAALNAWVEGGMPEGDPAKLPVPRVFNDEWGIGEPDVVLEMPEEVTIAATGVVAYRYFTSDIDFEEDRYVKAIEVRPGNMKSVHHIIIFLQEPQAEGDSRGNFTENMLDVYAPGSPPGIFPDGVVRKIPKGSKLIWQVHYTPTGKEEKDRSRLGIIFAGGPEKEVLRTAFAVNDDFKIPPHHDDYVVEASKKIPADATVYSFTPHMHYRGKAMDFFLKYPDGKEVLACSVPAYDFNWQLDYQLKEPLRVPAGTVFRIVGRFDNSANNPNNPDPSKPVRWGEQTWEEMLMGGIFLSWADEATAK
ncbi:MAG: cytochrome c [Candidatus Hydrogenedentes bacterium]|nr:cytochrome c [Candidatus Hydrogenedentota bacterium]